MHPVYTEDELKVEVTHREPASVGDKAAYGAMRTMRVAFDLMTGYGGQMTEAQYLRRILFLETVAGVPGMVGAMVRGRALVGVAGPVACCLRFRGLTQAMHAPQWRHLSSLRSMRRDKGWIHTLLEEAENERMHLLTFLQLRKPGWMFRGSVIMSQGIFFNLYFVMYVLAPRTCHRWVGFIEEEAVKTYTRCIEDLENGKLPEWEEADAPAIAKKYWMLDENAKMRDLLLAVRADEACHRYVNHTLADIGPDGANPFGAGSTHHD